MFNKKEVQKMKEMFTATILGNKLTDPQWEAYKKIKEGLNELEAVTD